MLKPTCHYEIIGNEAAMFVQLSFENNLGDKMIVGRQQLVKLLVIAIFVRY